MYAANDASGLTQLNLIQRCTDPIILSSSLRRPSAAAHAAAPVEKALGYMLRCVGKAGWGRFVLGKAVLAPWTVANILALAVAVVVEGHYY